MENEVQLRDKLTGIIIAPSRTVQIANWKGTGETVRVNAADVRDSDEVVPDSEQQYFADEIAAHEHAMYASTHSSSR